MPSARILLYLQQQKLSVRLNEALKAAGYRVDQLSRGSEAEAVLKVRTYQGCIIEHTSEEESFLLLGAARSRNPFCVVILLVADAPPNLMLRGIRAGVSDLLLPPFTVKDSLYALKRALTKTARLQARDGTAAPLKSPVSTPSWAGSSQALDAIGRSFTATLDLDQVLRAVVDAAVQVTGAEEGSLLILETDTEELVMRAAKNFQESFVRMFRLPVSDTIAGDVIREGRPVIINEDTPQKIITQYLVKSLLYVPLRVSGKVIGVVGVDNRQKKIAFTQEHLSLVSTLADYAAIAIENARLYQKTEQERQKLDAILNEIEDAVVVIAPDNVLLLVNRKARILFELEGEVEGLPLDEVFREESLVDFFMATTNEMPVQAEISLPGGYVLSAHLVELAGFGRIATMQDISYFKELDRVKTDFVNTVSHDLRSPLTAILGYVQLISRVGEVNDQQQSYIDRIQVNVHSISELINSLLQLGRIESGMDAFKENVQLDKIVSYVLEELRYLFEERKQVVEFESQPGLPALFGDPVRLRQVAENLITNAVLYTPEEGQIDIRLKSEGDQLILQVADNGLGIPLHDQPYIFDKFYRASNLPEESRGSGLGLAIVKSIVENHQGRVWVESRPGQGTSFTVVLPLGD